MDIEKEFDRGVASKKSDVKWETMDPPRKKPGIKKEYKRRYNKAVRRSVKTTISQGIC